jgi:hypothetical protein
MMTNNLHQAEMEDLAKGATTVHGSLKEVVLLKANNDVLLVFSDGFVLPTSFEKEGDDRWKTIKQEYHKRYFVNVARRLGGTLPLSLLTFGYEGTGPKCFSMFLEAAGFGGVNMVTAIAPLKIRLHGLWVKGVRRGTTIDWEDGSQTPQIATRKWYQFWK